MRIDEHMPSWDWRERHHTLVRASPEVVEAALRAVAAAEMPLVGALMAIRSLPSRIGRRRRPPRAAPRPVLDEIRRSGFALLGEAPGREVVFGIVGRFWQPCPIHAPIDGAASFAAFREPGWAKAAMNFTLEAVPGGTRLATETRIAATDAAARRRFRLYWLIVRPGSGLIRRAWLRAVRRRSETAVVGSDYDARKG